MCVCVCVFTQTFRDAGTSDYIVCYLRIVTSGYLQTNAEFFQAFVDEGKTIKEYCSEVSSVLQPISPAGSLIMYPEHELMTYVDPCTFLMLEGGGGSGGGGWTVEEKCADV